MDSLTLAKQILISNLQLTNVELTPDTRIAGDFPQFNSLTIAGIIASIEDETGSTVDDEEISAELFETVGSLAAFIESQVLMTAGTPTAVPYPAFLQGNAGRLFTLHFKPDAPDRGAILCVPPFGEEMNRTRALMAAQAREFAGMGYGCLLLDLFGTGDSGGDLPDATWEIWRSDVENAARWLADHSEGPISLWGIRLGCLLAAEVAAMHPDMFERLLFWQPVADGKTYLTQTLRLRVSALVDRNEPPETTAEMRERLAGGALLEVSGYVLPGALTEALDRTRLVDLKRLAGQRVDWLECVADAERPLPGGASKTLEQLTASGVEVQAHAVVAPQLWTLHKQAKADGLLHATSALFSERAGDER